ncbi:MAG: glycerate kinase [Bryobacterales bacterium]|nr:glycerate kinase [Bryobacterales bacterium]
MTRQHRHALRIFRTALKAADPVEAVRRSLRLHGNTLMVGARRYYLGSFERILVVGAGKAGATMASAVEHVLGRRITAGLINTKYQHTARLRRIELNECGHPVPDENGVAGARRIAELARGAGPHDLVLCLISGGASALMPLPAGPITLEEKQQVTRLLLRSGANIHEINAVRKHLSAIKGGQLARLAAPATVVALMLSDVIGDDLDVIGSGPTAPDASTFQRARSILAKYALMDQAPAAVIERLRAGEAGLIPETPKAGEALFHRVQNVVVGSNRLAVNAAALQARQLGYRPLVLSTLVEGETREIARMHAAIAREVKLSGRPVKPPACILSGGETTVTVKGDGKGGRNQEFALAAAIELAGVDAVTVLSAGTDGTDGPTDAAGAIADGETLARARKLDLEAVRHLAENNAYPFFDALGDLVCTGPTGTNVMDVMLVLVGCPA